MTISDYEQSTYNKQQRNAKKIDNIAAHEQYFIR